MPCFCDDLTEEQRIRQFYKTQQGALYHACCFLAIDQLKAIPCYFLYFPYDEAGYGNLRDWYGSHLVNVVKENRENKEEVEKCLEELKRIGLKIHPDGGIEEDS